MYKFILTIFLIAFTSTLFAEPVITRGPYLQKSTSNSVIVRWTTSEATDSVVRYGSRKNRLVSSVSTSVPTTDHVIEISKLRPSRTYYYTVGNTLLAFTAVTSETYFRTHPRPGSDTSTRIWVLGDSGRGNEGQLNVYGGYLKYVSRTKRKSNLWLMLGDNAYNDGKEEEYQTKLFDVYGSTLINTVLWPTFGNHDGYSASSQNQDGPYYDIFSLPSSGEVGGVASGTEAYYAFDYGKIHFICLNSYDVDRASTAQMAEWLKADLASTKQRWKIAYWHHPPYSKGSHDSDTESELVEMRENLLPILEQGGVDLVLSGHSHAYERTMLINGHYGLSTTLTSAMILNTTSGNRDLREGYKKKNKSNSAGSVYVVAGNGALVGGGNLNHPVMKLALFELGSLVIDVSRSRLTTNMINVNGDVVDSFSIDKVR